MKAWDLLVIGGGILGTSVAYWLSCRYDSAIAVLEQESEVGQHASRRNTGVIHRPFHLNPEKSRLFARSSLLSYDLWKGYASTRDLPWREVGTLKLAAEEDEVAHLETYMQWAAANGMEEDEVELLDSEQVRSLEPRVVCAGALHAKREAAVDFSAFTQALRKEAEDNGVRFLLRRKATGLESKEDGVSISLEGDRPNQQARYVINCAGGDAMDLAHSMGVAMEYTDLHFRGEYWKVDADFAHLAARNLYSVPRRPELPFLDPHWIVRASGETEIGPNAVPVAGPWTYRGFFDDLRSAIMKAFEPPLSSKARLALNPHFLQLALEEALGSISKSMLAARVRRFLPDLKEGMLVERGTAGVRSSVIDPKGNFVKEVLEVEGPSSTHILNYNSPGATGAPAYTASLLERLASKGHLDHLRVRTRPIRAVWDFEEVIAAF
jgi:L-2-hydroxyglutarate oxidase